MEISASYDTAEQFSLEQQRFFDIAIKQRSLNLGKLRAGSEAMLHNLITCPGNLDIHFVTVIKPSQGCDSPISSTR
jgi:hypothetical protein